MHTAVPELALLRRRYTGETHQEAHKAIIADLSEAKTEQDAAIPAAHSLHQSVLETSLLLSVRYAGRPGVISKVSPRHEALILRLGDSAATGFFRALLAPLEPHEGRDGVPGLRIDFEHGNLRLCLLDVDGRPTPSRVVVPRLTEKTWDRIWRRIQPTVYGGRCVDPLLAHSPKLSSGERQGYDFHWQHCGPVALGSALLRRIGLVAGDCSLDVWSGLGGTMLHLELDRGPTLCSLVADLCHPVAGMIRDSLELDVDRGPVRPTTTFAKIVDRSPTPDRFVGRLRAQGEPAALALRTLGPAEADR
ncbi:hypothetical protein ACWEOE_38290 [Amycolatopsis sp. NPDC004368]